MKLFLKHSYLTSSCVSQSVKSLVQQLSGLFLTQQKVLKAHFEIFLESAFWSRANLKQYHQFLFTPWSQAFNNYCKSPLHFTLTCIRHEIGCYVHIGRLINVLRVVAAFSFPPTFTSSFHLK